MSSELGANATDVVQAALVPTCHGNTRATAEAVIDSLRALPVEERMEAMGMELVGDTYEGQDEYKRPVFLPTWREADR